MNTPPTTVGRVIAAGAEYLVKAGVEDAGPVVELLLSRLLDCGRLDLQTRLDQPLDERRTEAMRRALRRSAAGEPVQYILGRWPFRDHTLRVDRRALIPRPETEVLVQVVLDCEALWADAAPVIADVGTGTGCIAISLALARPAAAFVALDVSEDALALARENAEALGVSGRIAFSAGEMPDVVEPESLAAVVSNPPYIPSAEVDRLPRHIREHEPRLALDGGADGLDVLRAVATDAAMALRAGGFLFLEMGADQAAAVRGILSDSGFEAIAILPDLSGRDRIARAQLP